MVSPGEFPSALAEKLAALCASFESSPALKAGQVITGLRLLNIECLSRDLI